MSFPLSCLRGGLRAAGAGLLLALPLPALAQQPNNDGFRRHNGQMEVVRNGQPRPMTRDIHLPTGATVTKDGFVVSPAGERTELREGQGCDLRGRLVAVRAAASGALALASPASTRTSAAPRAQPRPSALERLFGSREDEGRWGGKFKKNKKHKGKGKGHWKHDD